MRQAVLVQVEQPVPKALQALPVRTFTVGFLVGFLFVGLFFVGLFFVGLGASRWRPWSKSSAAASAEPASDVCCAKPAEAASRAKSSTAKTEELRAIVLVLIDVFLQHRSERGSPSVAEFCRMAVLCGHSVKNR